MCFNYFIFIFRHSLLMPLSFRPPNNIEVIYFLRFKNQPNFLLNKKINPSCHCCYCLQSPKEYNVLIIFIYMLLSPLQLYEI